MGDYAVTIKISNGRLRTAMNNAGFKSVYQLCKHAQLSPTEVGKLINMKSAPLNRSGQWRDVVVKLADALGVMPDDLFNASQRTMAIQKNHVTKFISEHEVHRLAVAEMNAGRLEFLQDNAAIEELQEEAMSGLCEGMMEEVLTPREAKILRLHTMEGMPYSEVGKQFDISLERVRQIELKALRKLRQHKAVQELMENSDVNHHY